MRTHQLKTWPSFWEDIRSERKTFEVRENDRDFAVGDRVELYEYDPAPGDTYLKEAKGYTNRVLVGCISYVLPGGRFGLPEKLCVFGLTQVVEQTRLLSGELVPVTEEAWTIGVSKVADG